MTTKPLSEVRGDWQLRQLPSMPAPWMVEGKTYPVVLRRWTTTKTPEVEVRDPKTDQVLATYSLLEATMLFDLGRR